MHEVYRKLHWNWLVQIVKGCDVVRVSSRTNGGAEHSGAPTPGKATQTCRAPRTRALQKLKIQSTMIPLNSHNKAIKVPILLSSPLEYFESPWPAVIECHWHSVGALLPWLNIGIVSFTCDLLSTSVVFFLIKANGHDRSLPGIYVHYRESTVRAAYASRPKIVTTCIQINDYYCALHHLASFKNG